MNETQGMAIYKTQPEIQFSERNTAELTARKDSSAKRVEINDSVNQNGTIRILKGKVYLTSMEIDEQFQTTKNMARKGKWNGETETPEFPSQQVDKVIRQNKKRQTSSLILWHKLSSQISSMRHKYN